jgi:glycosyltransferase involved in cell wall biosynthesis
VVEDAVPSGAVTGVDDPLRTRVLVVTYDQVGPRMAGPAIRAYELARVLAREHDVVLACRHEPGREGDGFRVVGYHKGTDELDKLVEWCDVVLAFGFLLVECPSIVETGKIVIADVYDPFTLEVLVQRRDDPFEVQEREHWGALAAMNHQLRHADLCLVASDRQRDLVFGMLAALNRINPSTYQDDPAFDRLISVVPFGLPEHEPVPGSRVLRGIRPGFAMDDLILLWAGGIYEWFDPLTLIDAVADLDADDVKLFFMGVAHPNPEVPEMAMTARAMARADERGVRDRLVFFNDGWVPYDDRVAYLLEADVGVSTHFPHVETAYAFRTRMLDYIWTGLPILCTEGDTLADLVARRDLGEVVPPEDRKALVGAIERLLDLGRRERCSMNLLELASEFRWERVAEPVMEFCRNPRHAPDRTGGKEPITPELRHLMDVMDDRLGEKTRQMEVLHSDVYQLRTEREGLLREIDELSAFRERTLDSLPYRMARRLRDLSGRSPN